MNSQDNISGSMILPEVQKNNIIIDLTNQLYEEAKKGPSP